MNSCRVTTCSKKGELNMSKPALSIVREYYPEVTRVVDSKKPVTISVTPSDCRKSKSGMPSECAMARAFKREYDGAIISLSTAYLISGKTAKRFKVPTAVAREIISFDRSHDFRPGKYSLGVQDEGNMLNRVRPTESLRPDRGHGNSGVRKATRKNHRTAGIRSL
jgi:hypothetical protein